MVNDKFTPYSLLITPFVREDYGRISVELY
jgi:hypothetical protein